ncbi:hypothetical protein APA_1787 [Pseudanabaena sp. lw0831]|nr:hypothetical protein APA_1787 [Pseudanabaena sp. lw0831]
MSICYQIEFYVNNTKIFEKSIPRYFYKHFANCTAKFCRSPKNSDKLRN